MKKLIFGLGLMVAGLTGSFASAQDYCCPVQYDPCCDPCCDGSFDGFYVGGNLGVYTDVVRRNDYDGFLSGNPAGFSSSDTEFTIGLQAGYDWVCGNRLLGLVVDWNWVNCDCKFYGDDYYVKNNGDWFTTIRARAGLTFCDALVYVTLGAAVIDVDTKWHDGGHHFHHSDTCWGWAGGVGAEFLAWCNWSLGVEVLVLHFNGDHKTFHSDTDYYRFERSDSSWVGRLILNYRFGDLCCCN